MDEFQFGPVDEVKTGERVQRPAGPAGGDPRHGRRRLDGGFVWILAAVLVVVGIGSFVFLAGGDEPQEDPSAVSPVDRALDAAAQSTIGRAVVVAQTLHAERGSFPSDVETLSALDPTSTFTAEPSGDPTSVSYAVGEGGFAAAVRSESGTCWWVRVDPTGTTTYGSGSSCTGQAAMAASDAAW
jgi:hypothetical protein